MGAGKHATFINALISESKHNEAHDTPPPRLVMWTISPETQPNNQQRAGRERVTPKLSLTYMQAHTKTHTCTYIDVKTPTQNKYTWDACLNVLCNKCQVTACGQPDWYRMNDDVYLILSDKHNDTHSITQSLNNTWLCDNGFNDNQTNAHSKPSAGNTVYFKPSSSVCRMLFDQCYTSCIQCSHLVDAFAWIK